MYPLLSREGLGMPALVMQALYTLVAYECGLLSPNSVANKLTAGPEEVTYFFAKFAKIKRIVIAVRTLHLPSSTLPCFLSLKVCMCISFYVCSSRCWAWW